MILVRIMGGLGNQFFTYATGYALARKNNQDLMLDEVIYQTYYALRECKLHEFSIDYPTSLLSFSLGHGKVGKKLFNLYHDWVLKRRFNPVTIQEQEQFTQNAFDIEPNKNYYLIGYWQHHGYFDNYRDDLRKQFAPKHVSNACKALIDQALDTKPVVMHVRRGDYVTFKGGKCLSTAYYLEALRIVREKRGEQVPIWVFTDDVAYCKSAFPQDCITYVSQQALKAGLSDTQEFWVMCHGADYILANSSFSWWAAYLNTNKDATVLAPVVDMWKEDFYLPTWTKIAAALE